MADAKHIIEFGPKFCQAQFDFVLREDVAFKDAEDNPQKTSHWKRSFSPDVKEVVFDLTLTEWVAAEEIAFLFAWIRNIKESGKKLKVNLPFRNNIENYLSKTKIQQIATAYKNSDGTLYKDDDKRIDRRRRSSAFLMSVYGLFTRTGLEESDFVNMADPTTYFKESERLRENIHQILPFTPFDLSANRQHIKYDTHFHDVINNNLDAQAKTGNIFELQKNIQQLLEKYSCYTPFESKILSNVVTQELYINSLQHSFETKKDKNLIPECYITAFLSNKWKSPESKNFVPSFLEEKLPETLDFYKDKGKILPTINASLKQPKHKDIESREADLGSFNEFKNSSYLEYTFLDFGEGIHSSLEVEFKKVTGEDKKQGEEAVNKLLNNPDLSNGFKAANKHSQMLEYAFLMDTSKNPLDKTIEYYELVPRGLYFLIDMVRRYKGLLIARSGNGKLIYDFSDRIYIENKNNEPVAKIKNTYKIRDAVKFGKNKDAAFFPGTIYTIVLPEKLPEEKPNDNTVIPAVRLDTEILSNYAYSLTDKLFIPSEHPKEKFYPNDFEYVSILFLYNNIIEQLKQVENEIHVKDIYNRLFYEINKVLDQHKDNNCIIFFDFAGLRTGNASWIKILYYLILTPKVNEVTKAIIVNLPSDEDKIIRDLKENHVFFDIDGIKRKIKIPEPYLYKPIPCINFNIDAKDEADLVEWFGLKESSDEKLLTQLLLGKSHDNYPSERFSNPKNTEGSLFVKSNDRVYPTYTGISNLRERFLEKQKLATTAFLKQYIENGYDEISDKEKFVYLASNGGYQFQYLSLYELLHDKYVARYFAKALLDNYCSYVYTNTSLGKEKTDYRFSKIITVTVSSQLIGVAIRDLIEEDDNYSFLRKEHKVSGGSDSAPDLIMLSSYYSFETEKPFDKIEGTDRILIVNDVISTGSLVKKLLYKLDTIKKVPVNAVFSIADTRIPNAEIDIEKEMSSEFFGTDEERFFTLASYDDGVVLRKFKGPYKGAAEKKRINPLLNTIVELKAEHGEQHKILYPDSSVLIDDTNIDASFFKIGHFQQNLTHNGYLTDMRTLFASDKGLYIIKLLKDAIEKKHKKEATNHEKENLVIRIVSIQNQLQSIENLLEGNTHQGQIEKISTELLSLKENVINDTEIHTKKSVFNPDFIFYPVFSGIEKISHFKLSNIFNTHPDNIIGLQRFDTPKGWRFPFPAKRFNELTKNKSVLIIDSGSLTGESLVQLIDNIGFLDVKEIVVLSVITRIEDFYREFYSRLKSLKVKRLKGKKEKRELANTIRDNKFEEERIVPIEVLFGINLHIPVYSPGVSCPFCSEVNYLKNVSTRTHIVNPPKDVNRYIQKRIKELKTLFTAKDTLENISYLPRIKKTNEIDTKGIFNTRDTIGKIDSYRFYPEYFEAFKALLGRINSDVEWHLKDENKREIELILTCILHEPNLVDLIVNMFSELGQHLKKYLAIVIDNGDLFETNYKWSKSSLIQLFFMINSQEFFNVEWFEKLMAYSDEDALQLIEFKIWDMLYAKGDSAQSKTSTEKLLLDFERRHQEIKKSDDKVGEENVKIIKILTDYYKQQNLHEEELLTTAFYNLKKFYLNGKYQGRHFLLTEKLNKLFEYASSTKPSLHVIREALQQVLSLVESDIKPNIEKIITDENIGKYYKLIETTLGEKKPGVLFYTKELESLNEFLQTQMQTELSGLTKEITTVKRISRELVKNILKEDDDKIGFFKLCNQYPCSVFDSLQHIADKNPAIEIYPELAQKNDNVMIAIHTEIFEKMMEEIIGNASRICDGILKIQISYELFDTGIKIRIEQNHPFVVEGKLKEGGLTHNVRYFAEKFGGSCIDNAEESLAIGNNFVITLNLLRHGFKIEN